MSKTPLTLHCKKCVTATIESGQKHTAHYRVMLLENDLYVICPVHDEPVGIFEVKNPVDGICGSCGT